MYVAVIGVGYWGPNILRVLESMRDVDIKYVCDVDESRLETYKSKYKCTTSIEEVLNDKDVTLVFIITPIWTHFDIICKCLRHGKNVFVEKPICKTTRELATIYEIADQTQTRVFCDYTFTHSDKIKKLKDIICSQKDEVLYVEVHRENFGLFSKDSVICDLLPHDISILNMLFDDDIQITFFEKIWFGEFLAKSVIHFSIRSIKGILSVSWVNEQKCRNIKIFCKNRIVDYNDIRDTINILHFDIPEKRETKEIININYSEPLKVSVETCMASLHNDEILEKNKLLSWKITHILEKILG